MKIAAIIQARMGSRRLPNKVLLKLGGITVIEHVVRRVLHAKTIKDVIVATTVKKEDLAIVRLLSSKGVSVYSGSENDVLDRYYHAARLFNVEHVVRITADCPLIDPKVIDKVVQKYLKTKADYCSNTLDETFPDGQDVEVFSYKVLARAWKNARLISEREHVTSYIKKHPKMSKLVSFINAENIGGKRWTLDEKEDYIFLKKIFKNLYKRNFFFGMEEILAYLEKNPRIECINSGIMRNEGYLKSLKEDSKVRL